MPANLSENPFDPGVDPERYQIWQRLVAVDCEAFAVGDWSLIEDDFDADAFEGVRCFHSANPDDWKIVFPTLTSYRESWLAASVEFRAKRFAALSHLEALRQRTHLDSIDVAGDRAVAHKKFLGEVRLADGGLLANRRQTLYRLHRQRPIGSAMARWRIVGFFGQLPLD
jgi:hypothetical protein